MSTPDVPGNSDSTMPPLTNTENDQDLSESIGVIDGNESWNDLSSPEPELTMVLTELRNRLQSQIHDNAGQQDITNITDAIGNGNYDEVVQRSLPSSEIPEWQKTLRRTLIFIGYTITTVLFSVIIYLHSLLVRCSYDEETSTALLDGVFRAQEKAIDDYHRRRRGQREVDDH
ncbi:hypothetical protein CANMA_005504 [Candida margitis]|uniref:uncharacterized protein n=1 Tax=Candida margitis TaxID=1775924 RepID=UPI002226EEE0|nr:uncharacterized protein CANMA_005504 [Candida margitis]KAI5949696.1 hypothetical protein CANMA_005504 [Candida margitis]